MDTCHFDSDFKDRLLAHFDDLDNETDGLLIHGENYQGLNLLTEKYRESVKTIYIDPPYNTQSSGFLYKNSYQHSSWLTFIGKRLDIAKDLLRDVGLIATAIDDEEQAYLAVLCDSVFGKKNHIGTVIVQSKPGGRTNDSYFATCHEYLYVYSKQAGLPSINFLELTDEQKKLYTEGTGKDLFRWRDFLRTGGLSTPVEAPNSYYPIYFLLQGEQISLERISDEQIEILPLDSNGNKRVWRKTRPSFAKHVNDNEIKIEQNKSGQWKVKIIDKIKEGTRPKSVWTDSKYDASSHGTKLLSNLFEEQNVFSYPKSIHAVKDVIEILTERSGDDIILDFFAGSGTTAHATINLNRKDNGNRKYILIEMGHHFDTALMPRIKKAVYAEKWKNAKPESRESHLPHIIKYQRIESYEDALNNIEFNETEHQNLLLDEHRLRYMLESDTKESPTFLNISDLQNPFSYQLKIVKNMQTQTETIDLPETFNYLLGLSVQKRKCLHDGERRYLVYRGTVDQKTVVIIWRETKGWENEDYERDCKFIEENELTKSAAEVYVNTNSIVPGAKSLDPLFKRLMFSQ